jgi:predicted nucleotidyltransferase
MRRDEIITKLKACEGELRTRGVTSLSLIGSVARGDDRPDSDVDVLIDVPEGRRFSLLDLCDVRLVLTDRLGRQADVLIRQDLGERIKARVEPDAAPVF